MKLPSKKFKIRIVHYHEWAFVVEYAYYRFIPVWHTVKQWDPIMGWRPVLVDEQWDGFGLKTMEDILAYHQREKKAEANYYEAQERIASRHKKNSGKQIIG